MPPPSPWWNHFFKGTDKYKGNQTYFEAFCRVCARCKTREIEDAEVDALTRGEIPEVRAQNAILEQVLASKLVEPLCGKINVMLRHIIACPNICDGYLKDKARTELGKRKNKENSGLELHPNSASHPPICSSGSSTSQSPSILQPHDQAAAGTERSTESRRAGKRQRCEGEEHTFYGVTIPVDQWTTSKQEAFEQDLCRLFVTCNISWAAVEHPFFRSFFTQWISQALLPGRKSLSGEILGKLAEEAEMHMRTNVFSRYATGQCDGWKNVGKESLVASMINVEYTPWLLNVFNISAIAKTAENLYELVVSEIKYCMESLSTVIVAYCTDAGGDAKAMRKLLRQNFPHIFTVDCWAHQINLLVGDYFKKHRSSAGFMDQAEELIKWFNNHSRALAMLRIEQLDCYKGVRALLYPVATRWSSRYLTCKRLLDLRASFVCLVAKHLEELVALTPRGQNRAETETKQQKTRDMLLRISNESFWTHLKNLRDHLAPFAVATNVLQSNSARLDTVLITLAELYRIFSDRIDFDDCVRQAVHADLEKRWKKIGLDREVFLITTVLNPLIRRSAFNTKNPVTTQGELAKMFARVFKRLMGQEPDTALKTAFDAYLGNKGRWSDVSLCVGDWKKSAAQEGIEVDVLNIWKRFDTGAVNGQEALFTFAARLLSIVPNTAATERAFSKMGAIHTKRRSRLKAERVRKMVIVKDDINRRLVPRPTASQTPIREPDDSDNEDDTSHAASFSAIVDEAVMAVAHEDHSAAEGAQMDELEADYADTVYLEDGLLLRSLFNFASPSYTDLAKGVWERGTGILDGEAAQLEHEAAEGTNSDNA